MATTIWVDIGSGNDLLPNHYLNHCWIIITKIQWDINLRAISQAITRPSTQLAFTSPRGQCINFLDHKENTWLEYVPWYATIIDKTPSTSSTSYEIYTWFYFGLISPRRNFCGFMWFVYAYFQVWFTGADKLYDSSSTSKITLMNIGKISRCQITTKHSNCRSASMFSGMYCTFELHISPSYTKHPHIKGHSLPISKRAKNVCWITPTSQDYTYRQLSNIKRTKSLRLKYSRIVLWLSLPNPLKPDVKSRMKM